MSKKESDKTFKSLSFSSVPEKNLATSDNLRNSSMEHVLK